MARTAVNGNVTTGSPYVVPTGKQAILRVMPLSTTSAVLVNAVQIARATYTSGFEGGPSPLCLNAGDTLSTDASFGFTGFLYDV